MGMLFVLAVLPKTSSLTQNELKSSGWVRPNTRHIASVDSCSCTFNPFPASHDFCRLHSLLLMFLGAYIANNMDPDQTAP